MTDQTNKDLPPLPDPDDYMVLDKWDNGWYSTDKEDFNSKSDDDRFVVYGVDKMRDYGRACTAAALSASAPAAGSVPSDHEIEMLATGFSLAHRNGLLKFARALLAQYGSPAWQPIETAPHETNVLLSWVDWDGKWQIEVGQASWGWSTPAVSNRSCHGRATHWMPLPPAPQEDK